MKINKPWQKIIFESLFWGVMFSITILFLGHFHHDYFNTFIFCLIWFPFNIGITLYINKVLIKNFLHAKRYVKFFTYLIYSFIVSSWIQILLIYLFFIVIVDLEFKSINPMINDLSMLWFVQMFISVLYTAIYQLKEEQLKKEKIHLLEKEKLQISVQLKELELNTLKDQIHPHFLFNTLNNIYGLALEKSDELPQILLQLSGLLDYLVYQSKEEDVDVKKELKVIQQYLELEKLRFDDKLNIETEFHVNTATIKITPFLLFPMVENAFKHGIRSNQDHSFLSIKSDYHASNFSFEVKNSKPQKIVPPLKGGTGLINLKKRLELCYPNKHELIINDEKLQYSITLKLELSHE
ncbi:MULTISPECIES: sensor histidine kinase [Flammeovirga]|uniref:Histidine kinase n=1 Tax=Flammeovirga agarivorans TaxID=2726742 RepID=A0A7X8XY61_9BACT|nr:MULTISPECIES: histidine kinase [Flammeovirga]NLR93916.1 histidine kinase [Flammeovirga agarivorans]